MPDERAAAHAQRREDVARPGGIDAPVDGRAHAAQRLGHAPHRPPRQRGVADRARSRTGGPRAGPSAAGSWCPNCRSRARPAAAVRPAKPTPWTRASSPASAISTPSARSAAAVDRLSPPRPSPRASTAPSASAPNSSARCEIDLSPGTRQRPAQRSRSPDLQRRCLRRHRCFTITSRRHFRFFASACNTASSLSASPSRLVGADVQADVDARSLPLQRQPVEHRREPEQHDHLLLRVEPRGIVPDRRRRGGVSGAVEQRQRRPDRGRRPGSAARRPGAARPASVNIPAARAPHAVGHRDRDRDRGRILVRVQRAAQLAQRAAARVRDDAPRRVDRRPHARAVALRERARRDQRDRPPLPLPQRAAPPLRRDRARRGGQERARDALGVEAAARDGQRVRSRPPPRRRRPACAPPP